MDDLEQKEENEEEIEDGASDDAVPENHDDEPVASQKKAANAGREAGATGKGRRGDEEEAAEEVIEEKPDERDQTIAELRERLEKIEKSRQEPQAQAQPQAPLTAEQKQQILDSSGFSDYKQVEWVSNQFQMLATAVKQYIDGKTGELSRPSVVAELAKQRGFEDALSYQGDINKFLDATYKGRVPDQDMLQQAYFYAKGKNANKMVSRVVNSREKNRRIAQSARPAGTGAAKGGQSNGSGVRLSAVQRSAARAFNMSDAEYAELLSKRGN